MKNETANDVLAKQNAFKGYKEVTNWANWRIRWTEMYAKDRDSAGTDEKVTN